MNIARNPHHNHLLAALPTVIFERIAPHLEPVAMPLDEVLYESGGSLSHVYFPTTAIVSLHCVMEDGAMSEIASVGNEGVVGTSLFMGGNTLPSRAITCIGGAGYRLKARLLMEEFKRGEAMQDLLLRYTQVLFSQVSQTAACNHHHSVAQRLCRWLLLTLNRLSSNELLMTQELIASILGVRRESITEAARHLQQMGCIHYHRGHIIVLDRLGLESRTCECYAVVKKEFYRLSPNVQKCQATHLASYVNPSRHAFTLSKPEERRVSDCLL